MTYFDHTAKDELPCFDHTAAWAADPTIQGPAFLAGDYICVACGYRISCFETLPECPSCHQRAWRLVQWRPVDPRTVGWPTGGGGWPPGA